MAATAAAPPLAERLRQAREHTERLRADVRRLAAELEVGGAAVLLPAEMQERLRERRLDGRPSQSGLGAGGGLAGALRPLPPAWSQAAPPRGALRRCLRVRLGLLEFDAGRAAAVPALLETSGVRVLLQLGAEPPVRWMLHAPATHQQRRVRFGRVVSQQGQYSTRACCDIDDEVDVPWSWPGGPPPGHLCADIWLERRTVAERLDSLLGGLGLGSDLPAYDRAWLGRAVCCLPPEGRDTVPQQWPVVADAKGDGPLPTALALGFEWVDAECEEEGAGPPAQCREAVGNAGGAAGALCAPGAGPAPKRAAALAPVEDSPSCALETSGVAASERRCLRLGICC